MATAKQKTNGLNLSGLFFEEACYEELLRPNRLVHLKEEFPYSYTKAGGTIVSGTADYIGRYTTDAAFSKNQIIFGIECKKVNETKTWVFNKIKKDKRKTDYDNPFYILSKERMPSLPPEERATHTSETEYQNFIVASKSYELREKTGNVANIPNEKVYLACQQANRATNGTFHSPDSSNFLQPGLGSTIYYMPLVLTNADLEVLEFESANIDRGAGIIDDEKVAFTKVPWLFYSTTLAPEDRISLHIPRESTRLITKPARRLVAVVNLTHVDDFLSDISDLLDD